MSRYRNILVAADGTEHANRALASAIALALAERARLTILTAVAQVPYPASVGTAGESVAALRRGLVDQAALTLDRASRRVPENVSVTKILTTDPIRPALTRTVAEGCYDLLVVGSRGRGAVRAALFGSVSRFAERRIPVPVLVVGPPAAEAAGSQTEARGMERLRHA